METWFSIQELLGLQSLPSSDRGIMKKADRENWEKRQRDGSYEDIMYCSKKVNEKSSKVYVNPSCYYDLGYRFTAPIYWCLSLDSSINKEVCEQYKKYRN